MRGEAYDSLSKVFEELNDDCDYEAWTGYLLRRLADFGAGRCGLELGCGSGRFCRELSRHGYCMSGADKSIPMLTRAQQLSAEEGLKISYFWADAARLKTPEKYDFILSPNDCMNYLPPAKLTSAFKSVRACLKDEGFFHFDISSAYKLREKVANTVSADDRDEVTYLCFPELKGDCVELNVTLFVRGIDSKYDRFDERHLQYIHEEENVTAALQEAGFREITVEGHLGEKKEGSDRLVFLCKK